MYGCSELGKSTYHYLDDYEGSAMMCRSHPNKAGKVRVEVS